MKWKSYYNEQEHQAQTRLCTSWEDAAGDEHKEELRQQYLSKTLRNEGLGEYLQHRYVQSFYQDMSLQDWSEWYKRKIGITITTIINDYQPDELQRKLKQDPWNEKTAFIKTLYKDFIRSGIYEYSEALYQCLIQEPPITQ